MQVYFTVLGTGQCRCILLCWALDNAGVFYCVRHCTMQVYFTVLDTGQCRCILLC